jgi:hypothetical protein
MPLGLPAYHLRRSLGRHRNYLCVVGFELISLAKTVPFCPCAVVNPPAFAANIYFRGRCGGIHAGSAKIALSAAVSVQRLLGWLGICGIGGVCDTSTYREERHMKSRPEAALILGRDCQLRVILIGSSYRVRGPCTVLPTPASKP